MKPDESIDTVLNALGSSDPPQGYEARIHNALLQAQQKPHRSFPQSRHPERSAAKPKDLLASLLPSMSWAAACAALLILGIGVRSYMHRDIPSNTPTLAHTSKASPQPSVAVANRTDTPAIEVQPSRATSTQKGNASIQSARIEVALQTHEYIPEPQMPLTAEERLVIRMMRRNTAQQLAEYTPDARARSLHEDAQAYNEYFAEKPLDGQPIYHQQISGGTQ